MRYGRRVRWDGFGLESCWCDHRNRVVRVVSNTSNTFFRLSCGRQRRPHGKFQFCQNDYNFADGNCIVQATASISMDMGWEALCGCGDDKCAQFRRPWYVFPHFSSYFREFYVWYVRVLDFPELFCHSLLSGKQWKGQSSFVVHYEQPMIRP